MKPASDADYVEWYARRLKADSSLFEQQRMLIEAQLEASKSLFTRMFEREDFKEAARTFLEKRGLLAERKVKLE